jgi:fumarate reductase flavoprotein subunit
LFCALTPQMADAAGLRTRGIHNEKNVSCKDCHKVEQPKEPPASTACLECHGPYEKVAQRTRALHVNPHDSHMGPVDCLKCHSVHDQPEAFEGPCVECHVDFEFKVK